MATVPNVARQDEFPRWTVDVLLAENRVEEARTELMRLIDEGDADDPGVEATPDFYQGILAEVRRRAEARR